MKHILILLFSLQTICSFAQNGQDKRISCSYYNYEVLGFGYMYNHSWNDYIRGYNAALVPPAGITHLRWGRPFIMDDFCFTWGYSRFGSPHHLTITASFDAFGSSLYGKHISRDQHLSGSEYTFINYYNIGIGLGYMHTPSNYENLSSFVSYGAIISATSNSFEISYNDSLDQSSKGIYSTMGRIYLNYNAGGPGAFVTFGVYAQYSLPNRIHTNLFSQYLPYPNAPSQIYVNPASAGLTLTYSFFPHNRKAQRSAKHYQHGDSYTPQVHSSNLTARNYNFEIKGQIIDSISGKPVNKALLTFTGHGLKPSVKLNTNAKGNYDMRIHLMEATDYTWQIMTTGYMPYTSTQYIDIVKTTGIDTIVKNIVLVPFKKGDVVPLDHITFAKGTAQLSDKSLPEMDNIVAFLDMNPFMTIQINGYTSSENIDEKSNIKLSLDRAKAIRKYLKSKGIRGDRVKVQGYGSSRPFVKNDSEEHREENRRVEFVILKI